MVSPDSRDYRARRQAETPLSVLCRFPEPALTVNKMINALKAPIDEADAKAIKEYLAKNYGT